MTLGMFWVGQHTQLDQLERSDRDLSWLHFLFLALVTVMPFTTQLLAEFITFPPRALPLLDEFGGGWPQHLCLLGLFRARRA